MPRRLLYVIPTIAVVIVGYAVVGPARSRGVDAARVLGAPDADGHLRNLRVVAAHRADQRDAPLSGEVRVAIGQRGAIGSLSTEGVAEVELPVETSLGDKIEVTLDGKLLARGVLRDATTMDDERHVALATEAYGDHDGAFRVSARLLRGPLVPPFSDRVRIDVEDPKGQPVDATLDVRFEGGSAPQGTPGTPPQHTVDILVSPIADQVEIDVTAKTPDGRIGTLTGKLPTTMGGFWLQPAGQSDGPLTVVAAAPRSRAYVSLFDDRGRLSGHVVALEERSDGFHAGSFQRSRDELRARYALLSSDEREDGRAVTAWSLDTIPVGAPPVRLLRLGKELDGFPDALAIESQRQRRVHHVLGAFVVALALLEVLLLGALAGRARRDLAHHFKATSDPSDESGPAPIQPVRSTLLVPGFAALLVGLSTAALVTLTLVSR